MAHPWNLGQIMSRATELAGKRDDISLSDASFWANEAYTAFCRDFSEFLSERTAGFSVSSGDSLLTIPADFREPIALSEVTTSGNGNTPIPQMSIEDMDADGYWPVGAPKGWAIYGDKIQLWPSISSSALTTHASSGRSLLLRYKWIPESMMSNVSVPSVATEHRIAIMEKTVEFLHRAVGNQEEAILAEARYTQLLASFKDSYQKRQMARGGFRIRLADRAERRMDGDLADQTTEWLRRRR